MIKTNTIIALCEEAGLDPTRVSCAEIYPHAVVFTVYSVNIYGEKMVDATKNNVISHWVRVPIG